MEFNPYTDKCNKLQKIIAKIKDDKQSETLALTWYYNTDLESLKQELQQRAVKIQDRESQIKVIEGKVVFNNSELNKIEKNIKSMLNPLNWFSDEQIKHRKSRDNIKHILTTLSEEKKQELNLINTNKSKISDLESNALKYRNFDADKSNKNIAELESSIDAYKKQLDELSEKKEKVDFALTPILEEIKKLRIKSQEQKEKINEANRFEIQLSHADNSYERAIIHEQCERKLGDGKPKKIIIEQEKILRQIERDIEKAQKRATEIGSKASRVIDTIIIDGNNTCYERSAFIGLNALKALVSELQKKFHVIVVFDSSIRKILKSNDNEITSQFEGNTKIHIVANKQFADATILDLASNHTSIYVISNDRFGDYNDKEVVKNNRLIRHEIINNRVFVHDLNINLTFT